MENTTGSNLRHHIITKMDTHDLWPMVMTEKAIKEMFGGNQGFDGIKIDTDATMTSIMCTAQYDAYCVTYHLQKCINPLRGKNVKWVGSVIKVMGKARILMPCK